jgi:hypothetical protein
MGVTLEWLENVLVNEELINEGLGWVFICATANFRSASSGKVLNQRPSSGNVDSGVSKVRSPHGNTEDKRSANPQLVNSFLPLRLEPCAFRLFSYFAWSDHRPLINISSDIP